ncbi:MAG: hypothetical protein ABI810_08305 [Sphingomonas bacterium]
MVRTYWCRLGAAGVAAMVALAPAGVRAQAEQGANPDIVVSSVRSKLSNWRQAETRHVVLLSDGDDKEVARLARNLEWLHYVLSGLMGKSAAADDDLVPIRVTLIGDVAQFDDMNLRNLRWQQGPFNDLFQIGRYYDPREDGAVMASTRVDQRVVVEHTSVNAAAVQGLLSSMASGTSDPNLRANLSAGIGTIALAGMQGPGDTGPTFGEKAIQITAEQLLYAGYAQHFLLTYYPAAYPRWYLDGFGQVFSTFAITGDKQIEFGRAPQGAQTVVNEFGAYPIKDVLNDAYLTQKPANTRWTPMHAWMLAHFLFFSDARRPQLSQYLLARARGQDAAKAAAVFGDQAQLGRELRAYFAARKPAYKVTYANANIEEPTVRRLRESEAAFVKGRLELGARVVIPPAPPASADPAIARAMTKARDQALADRARWLDRLRGSAARWSGELGAQLLLTEAECRSGNAAEALVAIRRAEALAPADPRVLVWKGTAMILQAATLAGPERANMVAAGRKLILTANKADNDAVVPLLAYYRSYAVAGEAPGTNAVDALARASEEVPAAPETRLALAWALAREGEPEIAQGVILPVAVGPYNSPERPAAEALLSSLRQGASAASGGGASMNMSAPVEENR